MAAFRLAPELATRDSLPGFQPEEMCAACKARSQHERQDPRLRGSTTQADGELDAAQPASDGAVRNGGAAAKAEYTETLHLG